MEKIYKPNNFSFNEISKSIVIKEIEKLNPKKNSQSNDIPPRFITEFFAKIIVKDFNKCLNNGTVPESFKISEVVPVFKR